MQCTRNYILCRISQFYNIFVYNKIVKLHVVASKVHVIRWYYLQELLHDVNCKTVSKEMYIEILRRLRDAVRRKRLVNWRTFTTMLQHTGRFRSRISYRKNTSQHWSTPKGGYTLVTLPRTVTP